jgi:PST family polysaccharide transporter
MGSILKATLILGSGSAISLVAGFLSNKAYAVWVGPEGVGLLGLLQGLLAIAAIVAGMGLSAGLVRVGAPHTAEADPAFMLALRQAAWQIYRYFSGAVALLILFFSQPIAHLMLAGSPIYAVVFVLVALLMSLAAGVQVGLLNAYHRVGALARITALSSVAGAVWGIGLVWIGREAALPLVVLGTPLAQLALSTWFAKGLGLPVERPAAEEVRRARDELLRFGLPFTGSQLVGSAVQLGMPFLVLHQLGQENVGYYRAAVLFSTAYIGFLLNALGQDFYPRLSALQDRPVAFQEAIHAQQRFVLLLGSPLVAGSLALAPMIVTLLFSPQFRPTVAILQWQLLGDLLRFVSWTLGYAVLARLSSRFYLLTETLGGGLLLVFSLWGMRQFGLQGLGMGWFATYAVYLVAVTWILVRKGIWIPALSNVGLLLLGLGVAVAVRLAPEPWALAVAVSWGLVCAVCLSRQVWSARARGAER